MPEHNPSGWWDRCTLDVRDDLGRAVGVCNEPFWKQWIASEHRAKRQPHECRAELGLRAMIVAQELNEVKP